MVSLSEQGVPPYIVPMAANFHPLWKGGLCPVALNPDKHEVVELCYCGGGGYIQYSECVTTIIGH